MPRLNETELFELRLRHFSDAPQPGELYQHAESGQFYRVVALALDEATHAPLIVYSDRAGACWCRPLGEFREEVDVEPLGRMPRFVHVPEDEAFVAPAWATASDGR